MLRINAFLPASKLRFRNFFFKKTKFVFHPC
jgi:hypothetical protein